MKKKKPCKACRGTKGNFKCIEWDRDIGCIDQEWVDCPFCRGKGFTGGFQESIIKRNKQKWLNKRKSKRN